MCVDVPVDVVCMIRKPYLEEIENLKKTIEQIRKLNELKYSDYEKRMSDNATIIVNLHNKIKRLENELKENTTGDSYWKDKAEELEKQLEEGKRKWKYFDSRFVETTYTCTQEEREKCLMFPQFCEGEEKKIIDLEELIDKGIENAKERGEIK